MKHALLVIDAQQELIEGNASEQGVYNKEGLIQNINVVIEKAKQAKAALVFVRDVDVSEGEGAGFEVHSAINVPEGARVFDKQATNAFYNTPLLSYLKEEKIGHLVMMGCKTEHCIDTAVRFATVSGFDVTLVEDGHSTSDSEVLKAEQIVSHHNKVLHGHYNVDYFSVVRKTDEDLFTPIHDNYRSE